REFASARLDEAGRAAVSARHGAYFLELVEGCTPELAGVDGPALLGGLDADHANIRAALDALTAPEELARMTSALWRFWLLRGHSHEAQTGMGGALELALPDARRAELLYQFGTILISRGRVLESERALERALALYRSTGDRLGEARALMALGHSAGDRGE